MNKQKKWYFSWPAIVVWLLIVQFCVQCYVAKLPDNSSNYKLSGGIFLLYFVFITLVIIGKYEQDEKEKSKLRYRIKELEETVNQLKSNNKQKTEEKQ